MDQKPTLPEGVLKQLEEHASCFCLFYFDGAGLPILYTYYPEVKDKMAIMKFLMDYLNADMPMIGPSKPLEGEEPESD